MAPVAIADVATLDKAKKRITYLKRRIKDSDRVVIADVTALEKAEATIVVIERKAKAIDALLKAIEALAKRAQKEMKFDHQVFNALATSADDIEQFFGNFSVEKKITTILTKFNDEENLTAHFFEDIAVFVRELREQLRESKTLQRRVR